MASDQQANGGKTSQGKNSGKAVKQASLTDKSVETGSWFRSALGRYLLRVEKLAVTKAISRFFGYHQLEVLLREDLAVGESSLLGHRIIAIPKLNSDSIPEQWTHHHQGEEGVVLCLADELPFANDSINLVILHHTLDTNSNPHQTLREVCRVLRSGGHIVIVGFNPFSSWGLRKLINRSKKVPWSNRFLTPHRLEDWLSLLDFQTSFVSHQFYLPPISKLNWLRRFGFLEKLGQRLRLPLGAFYVIQAQKRVAGSIAQKPLWHRRSITSMATVHQFTPHEDDEKS